MDEPDCSLELSLALPEGWTFNLQLKRGEDQSHGGLAELHENGVLRCRRSDLAHSPFSVIAQPRVSLYGRGFRSGGRTDE